MTLSKSEIGKHILRRVRWLYFFFLLAAVAIFGRVLWIQFGPQSEQLREKALEITFDRRPIPALRGDILARDGRILATTIPEYDIRMDFAVIDMPDSTFERHADSLAICLSEFIGGSRQQYMNILLDGFRNKERNRYRKIIDRPVNYEEQKILRTFPIFRLGKYRGGYIAEQRSRRFAPMGSLARKAIGAVENDTIARDGIEASYNEPLRGTTGNSLMQRISGTFWVPVPDPLNMDPVNGMDIVTTIDVDIQDVAESMLKQQLEAGGAYWGTVILMEVQTGEVHAMCNLTRQGPGVFAEDFNYAIRSRNEPGSTFKLATLIALLEDGGMTINDMVDCSSDASRRAWVGRAHISDDHREGIIPLKRVFEVSSNIGFARSVFNIYENNPARFVDFISEKLHFGSRTGIDLENEFLPDIKHPGNRQRWDRTTLQMMAYGYAFEVTPLSTLTFYNAVANNGMMMQPMLVKEVRSYGETVERFGPTVIDSAICSQRTIRDVRMCLEGVVDEGTGRILKNPYYTAAAKTGTAQVVKATGGYGTPGNRDYLASFVGYFPADNPKYSCIVAIKTRQQPGKTYYGASLAGPVFRAIADRVYAKSIELHDTRYPPQVAPVDRHTIKTGDPDKAATVLTAMGLRFPVSYMHDAYNPDIDNSGTYSSVAGAEGGIWADDTGTDMAVVPDVSGMGMRDALYAVEANGFRLKYSGRGKVASQYPLAGTQAPVGTEVVIKLN